jgi:hypothetical protein
MHSEQADIDQGYKKQACIAQYHISRVYSSGKCCREYSGEQFPTQLRKPAIVALVTILVGPIVPVDVVVHVVWVREKTLLDGSCSRFLVLAIVKL